MGDEFENLGWQETVGDKIRALFPEGFQFDAYVDILLKYSKSDRASEDRYGSKINSRELRKQERQLRSRISKEFWRRIEKPTSEEQRARQEQRFLTNSGKDGYLALPFSPFDMFAIANSLLKASGAYHHIEGLDKHPENTDSDSNDAGSERVIIVSEEDRTEWVEIGEAWCRSGAIRYPLQEQGDAEVEVVGMPSMLIDYWMRILEAWDAKLFDPKRRSNTPPDWWRSATALLVISDVAAVGAGISSGKGPEQNSAPWWASFAAAIITDNPTGTVHTLSAAARDQISVLPKTLTAQIGVTLRSLSHNLAALPIRGAVRATWAWQDSAYEDLDPVQKKPFNAIIIPYPYVISAECFRPVSISETEQRRGRFEFSPACPRQYESGRAISEVPDLVFSIYKAAKKAVGTVHAIILPELSMTAAEFSRLARKIEERTNVELLCAGVRQRFPDNDGELRRKDWRSENANQCVMVSFPRHPDLEPDRIHRRKRAVGKYEKHHRWKLSGSQIRDYGISSSLDPSLDWWEDIHILNRKLPFMVMRDRWLVTTLICEDLARIDPAQEMVRAIGPNLVVALLMDGPQLSNRWSARYATVLADDPGSAVLTLNSLGLVNRSAEVRRIERNLNDASRAVALWRDDTGVSTSIELPEDHHAVCLTIAEHPINEMTLDGRCDKRTRTALRLSNYFPIKISET